MNAYIAARIEKQREKYADGPPNIRELGLKYKGQYVSKAKKAGMQAEQKEITKQKDMDRARAYRLLASRERNAFMYSNRDFRG